MFCVCDTVYVDLFAVTDVRRGIRGSVVRHWCETRYTWVCCQSLMWDTVYVGLLSVTNVRHGIRVSVVSHTCETRNTWVCCSGLIIVILNWRRLRIDLVMHLNDVVLAIFLFFRSYLLMLSRVIKREYNMTNFCQRPS